MTQDFRTHFTLKTRLQEWKLLIFKCFFVLYSIYIYYMPVAFDFSHQGHTLITLYAQFLCADWSKLDRWVHVENLCSILKLVYFDSWSWQSFVSTCDVFNCLSPLNVQNEIQLLSRVFCYSWLVCLLGFWLRNMSLVKVGNPIPDGIVFVFHLAWCVRGLKILKRFWPYLIAFQCISNGEPE